MSAFDKLVAFFRRFHGIGPRQAKRFVFFLLSLSSEEIKEFTTSLSELKNETVSCNTCFRFFRSRNKDNQTCPICLDPNRTSEILMIVPKDVDLETVEKSAIFDGKYFVIGGTVPLLEKMTTSLRFAELKKHIEILKKNGLKEIIIASNINPEGEHTAEIISSFLSPIIESTDIKISSLGRGLSTGTELEYTDPDTLKSALSNRVGQNNK